jgi:NADH oxidase (H2O2-forming)
MLQVKAGEEFLPYVYAGGGCVEVTDFITGESRLSQLGTTAKRMAEIIGDNIIGKQITFGPIADPWVSLGILGYPWVSLGILGRGFAVRWSGNYI